MANVEFLHSDKAPAAIGPYSQGTKAQGKQIYVSGQLPIKDGALQTEIKSATKASLENILEVVKAGGGKLEDIVRVGVFMTDLGQFTDMNDVYTEFFGEHKPARAAIQVCALPKGAIVEIEAIAVVE